MEAVILIGIQATGKSSFYKERFFKSHIRINLDMLKTRHREDIIVEACIKAKQPFVIDNTNPLPNDRKKYIAEAKKSKYKVIGYYFHSSFDDAVARNKQRTGKERVPLIAIKGTYAKLCLPSSEEGFDELYIVWIDMDGKFVVQKIDDSLPIEKYIEQKKIK